MCYTNSYIKLVIGIIVNVLLYFQALEVAIPIINRLLRLWIVLTYQLWVLEHMRSNVTY